MASHHPPPPRQHLADPLNYIARIRARMPKNCGVRQSEYCDFIISLRMQGYSYYKIRDWLIQRGPEHAISVPTLARHLGRALKKQEVALTYIEEQAEKWGGRQDLDLAKELASQILTQKDRIDAMVRAEKDRQKESPRYVNGHIRREMETMSKYMELAVSLQRMLDEKEKEKSTYDPNDSALDMTIMDETTEEKLVELILDGKVATAALPMKVGDLEDIEDV